jgi:hypothetical protein
VILAEIRDSQNVQAGQIQVLIESVRHDSEESHTNYNTMGHLLQRVRHLEEANARPPAAPDEVVITLDPRVEELAKMVGHQGQQLHLVQESFKREDHGVTRRPGQQQAFGGNNLSGIERAPDGDSPVGSDEIFDEAEPTLVRSALGAQDVTQVEIIGDIIAAMGQKLAETLNKTLGKVLDRVSTGGGPGGNGGDGSDDDDPPDPRDRPRRGKPRSRKEDDESSEGGEPFRRP